MNDERETLDTIDDDEVMTVADGAVLQNLEVIISKAALLKGQIISLEEALKAAKRDLRNITNMTLPDAMQAASANMHRTTGGVKVEVLPLISATLPKDERREDAIRWISQNAPELLKTTFKVVLGKGTHNQAKSLEATLTEMEIPHDHEYGVHASTLKAWVKEKVKKNKTSGIPLDLLGAFVGRYAKITLPDGTKIGGEVESDE